MIASQANVAGRFSHVSPWTKSHFVVAFSGRMVAVSAGNYSALTLRSSITLRQAGISAAMMADSSAGVLVAASTP